MRLAFITNVLPHYRIKTFETLAKYYNIKYLLFSTSNVRFGPSSHGDNPGAFEYQYFSQIRLGVIIFPLNLTWHLISCHYDVYIKCINDPIVLILTYAIARLKRKPFILWTGVWMRINSPAHQAFGFLIRYIQRHSDAVVVYGEHVKQFLMQEKVSPERIFIAPHCVDNHAYNQIVEHSKVKEIRRGLNIDENVKIILYVGRLIECKGLTYLIDGFSQLNQNDAILVIAGTGPEKEKLQQLVHAKNLVGKVRFLGYINPDNTIYYYASSWVFVLPSITTATMKETWGLVVNEAFNQGLPVIATDAVGAAVGGLVVDGHNGFVVPEKDSKSIAKALNVILNTPELRTSLSINATETIKYWNNENMVKGFRSAIKYVNLNFDI